MHQQLPAGAYAGLPHAPTIQQVKDLGQPVNPEPQSPINPALMAQPNQQQQMQVSVLFILMHKFFFRYSDQKAVSLFAIL